MTRFTLVIYNYLRAFNLVVSLKIFYRKKHSACMPVLTFNYCKTTFNHPAANLITTLF